MLGVPAALLNDDRLGRSLEALAGAAEDVRGKLLLAAVRRFAVADASRLHLDLTAVRFAGSYPGSALVEKGWAADRTIARQVKTLQATTLSGAAVYFRPHNGLASELPAFMAAIEALAAALPPGLVVVADSGLGYLENLCAADDAHVTFVIPLRADTGWAARFGAYIPGGPHALPVLDHLSWRERDPAAGLITVRTRARAGKPVITWARDHDAIAAASRLDGLYALATNLPGRADGTPLTALDVLTIYKDQWIVEQRHRDLKQTLKVRPVFLHNDDRIEALIAIIGIALLIFGLIEAELRAALGTRRPAARHPARRPRRHPHRPGRPGRLRRPALDLYLPRDRPGPPDPGSADHPGPPGHPAAMARKTSLNPANHDRRSAKTGQASPPARNADASAALNTSTGTALPRFAADRRVLMISTRAVPRAGTNACSTSGSDTSSNTSRQRSPSVSSQCRTVAAASMMPRPESSSVSPIASATAANPASRLPVSAPLTQATSRQPASSFARAYAAAN